MTLNHPTLTYILTYKSLPETIYSNKVLTRIHRLKNFLNYFITPEFRAINNVYDEKNKNS